MNFDLVVSILHGWFFLLGLFAVGMAITVIKGRQMLVNLMMGMYLGLLLYTEFPYLEKLVSSSSGDTAKAIVSISIFLAFSVVSMILFSRLMPREYYESAFETFGSKFILAVLFCVLALGLSLHYLPVGDIIPTGMPLPEALLSDKLAYVWLILPLVGLFFL